MKWWWAYCGNERQEASNELVGCVLQLDRYEFDAAPMLRLIQETPEAVFTANTLPNFVFIKFPLSNYGHLTPLEAFLAKVQASSRDLGICSFPSDRRLPLELESMVASWLKILRSMLEARYHGGETLLDNSNDGDADRSKILLVQNHEPVLHLACNRFRDLPFRFYELILEYEPDAVRVPIKDLYRSDEVALERFLRSTKPSPEVARLLFRQYPDAVKMRSSETNDLRFLDALSHLTDLSTFQEIVAYEPALLQEDGKYGSVLHRLCVRSGNKEFPVDIVEWIAEEEPTLLTRTSGITKNLPLHLVRGLSAARILIEAYPEALSIPNADNNLPLHMIVSLVSGNCHGQGQKEKTVLYVAGQYPKALLHRNAFQQTPLDIIAGEAKYKIYGKEEGDRVWSTLQSLQQEQQLERNRAAKYDERTDIQGQLKRMEALVRRVQSENEDLRARVQALEQRNMVRAHGAVSDTS